MHSQSLNMIGICTLHGECSNRGLGGRWGPYRLDVGQKLVQVSEDKKQGLDEATKRKAQQMADEAYQKRHVGMTLFVLRFSSAGFATQHGFDGGILECVATAPANGNRMLSFVAMTAELSLTGLVGRTAGL